MAKQPPKPKKRTDTEARAADDKARGTSTTYYTGGGEKVTVVRCRQCEGKGGPCCNNFGFMRQGELAL